MLKTFQKGLVISFVITAMGLPVFADEAVLQEVDLSTQQDKVVDVVTGAKWLGKKVGHGAKAAVKFVYRKGLRPIGVAAGDLAELTSDGAVYVALKVKKGAVTVEHVVVRGSDKVYTKALRPLIVKPLTEVGRLVILDGAYKMILRPLGKGVKSAAENDLVTGIKAIGRAEKEGASDFAADAARDGKAVYRVVLKPVGKTVANGAEAVANGVSYVVCKYVDSFRNEPTGCSAEAEMQTQN